MGDWLAAKLESLGVKVEKRPLGKQMLEGQELDLPAALLGELGNDPNKVRFSILARPLRGTHKYSSFCQTENPPHLRPLRCPARQHA
jgi:hypothetical protein